MARNNDRDRGKRKVKDTRPDRGKKKVCIFCTGQVPVVDYKDINTLRRFISDRGKLKPRRTTGNCTQHQAGVAVAVKTARELALLPYTQRTVSERGPGRGGRDRGDRGPRPEREAVTIEAVALGEFEPADDALSADDDLAADDVLEEAGASR